MRPNIYMLILMTVAFGFTSVIMAGEITSDLYLMVVLAPLVFILIYEIYDFIMWRKK